MKVCSHSIITPVHQQANYRESASFTCLRSLRRCSFFTPACPDILKGVGEGSRTHRKCHARAMYSGPLTLNPRSPSWRATLDVLCQIIFCASRCGGVHFHSDAHAECTRGPTQMDALIYTSKHLTIAQRQEAACNVPEIKCFPCPLLNAAG